MERAWVLGGAAGFCGWDLTALAALSFASRSSQPRSAARVVSRAWPLQAGSCSLNATQSSQGPLGGWELVWSSVLPSVRMWLNKGVMGLLCLGLAHSRHSAEEGPAGGAHRTLNPELRLGLETAHQCCAALLGEAPAGCEKPSRAGLRGLRCSMCSGPLTLRGSWWRLAHVTSSFGTSNAQGHGETGKASQKR